MDSQAFDLLMARFDTLEEQNREQLELLSEHITEDNKVHRIVVRHGAYWKLVSGGAAIFAALLASKLGLK